MQGDFLDQAVELIMKQYSSQVKRGDIFFIDSKKKQAYFEEDEA
jgi:hypothetical protein